MAPVGIEGGFDAAHLLHRVRPRDFDRSCGMSAVRPSQPTGVTGHNAVQELQPTSQWCVQKMRRILLRQARGGKILRPALLRLLCVQELRPTTHWCLRKVRGVLLHVSRWRSPSWCVKHPGGHGCRDTGIVRRLHSRSVLDAVRARAPMGCHHPHLDHSVRRSYCFLSVVTQMSVGEWVCANS